MSEARCQIRKKKQLSHIDLIAERVVNASAIFHTLRSVAANGLQAVSCAVNAKLTFLASIKTFC